jgi:hypothetical protein
MRFEQAPGSEETLLALYDAVVAAEELDLAEQAADEAAWAEFVRLTEASFDIVTWWNDGDRASAASGDELAGADDVDDDDRPSMSQAVGVVEHLLGGHPVSGGEPTG